MAPKCKSGAENTGTQRRAKERIEDEWAGHICRQASTNIANVICGGGRLHVHRSLGTDVEGGCSNPRTISSKTRLYPPFGLGTSLDVVYDYHRRFTRISDQFSSLLVHPFSVAGRGGQAGRERGMQKLAVRKWECMVHGTERSIEDVEESEAVQQEESLDPWLCLEPKGEDTRRNRETSYNLQHTDINDGPQGELWFADLKVPQGSAVPKFAP
ncbi:hypothetical protein EV368DRAFT_67136 [Lentinula lateritia]|nr:hypothetical protein EV368DRAFT_67136 [Lentinula lateritia]